MLVKYRIAWSFPVPVFPAEVFPDSNELHLRSDDAEASIVHLGYARAALRAQRRTSQRREVFQFTHRFCASLFSGLKSEISIIDRFLLTTFVFFDVATTENPFSSQKR